VTRRPSLPGADELFRPTGPAEGVAPAWLEPGRIAARRGTPRQKHTSKITVYVSDEELLALEHARLALRAAHGLAVDRGRVVREAIALVLADLDEHGEESVLVRRLRHDE
jgi:L-aminopeptidase/D-esterase-like protein